MPTLKESASLDSALDRRNRREQELKVLDQERLRLHQENRRRQRELRPARLQYVESPTGWILAVPPIRSEVRLMVGIIALAAAAMLAILVFEHDWVLKAMFLFLILVFAFGFGGMFLGRFPRMTRFNVGRDGQLTVQGRRASDVLHRGQAGASTVEVDFAEETALAKWKLTPGDESKLSFYSCGDVDIQVLKAFCAATRIVFKTALPEKVEEAEKAEFVPWREQRAKIRVRWITWIIVSGLLGGLVVLVVRHRSSDEGPSLFGNKSLTGTFHSTNKELGEWTLTPSACLSGRERGFEGIAFQFPVGGPVEEIRMDAARQGDNVVEIRLADRKGTVARFRERECQAIDGEIEQTNVEVIGRPMVRLKGHEHFSCPAFGLSGDADFDGCLPQ